MNTNIVIHWDCLSVLKEMKDGFVDLTVTSPPYDNLRTYNGYSFDFEWIAKELFRVTKEGWVIVWVVWDATIKWSESWTSFKQALYFKEIWFNLNDTMIWNKGSFSAVGALKTRYAPVFEYMFVFSKGKIKNFNPIKDRKNKHSWDKKFCNIRQIDGTFKKFSKEVTIAEYWQRFNIWEIAPKKGNKIESHPAVFPEKLAEDHILSWSNPWDIVLDCFAWSGTTLKMAKKNGRNYIWIEISEEYIEIIKKRLEI